MLYLFTAAQNLNHEDTSRHVLIDVSYIVGLLSTFKSLFECFSKQYGKFAIKEVVIDAWNYPCLWIGNGIGD